MRETENKDSREFHFFGSNIGEWQVSEDVDTLIKAMKKSCKQGNFKFFALYYVPQPIHEEYEINFYKPVVDGCVFLGTYNTK